VIRRPANSEEVTLALKLRDAGVPFDTYELERMRAEALGLSMLQSRNVESTVDSSGEPTLYIINAVIRNDSPRSLSPSGIQFEGPAWEPGIALFKNPKWPRKRIDGFPDVDAAYGGQLLNYIITRKRIVLLPGESVTGIWLACGQAPVPYEYHDRDLLEIRVALFDQKGHCDQRSFWLTVNRTPAEIRRISRLEGTE
jgi:hypothetical protein